LASLIAAVPQLPIRAYKRVEAPGLDGLRWRVWLSANDNHVPLIVDLCGTQATISGLPETELDSRLAAALQRLAEGRLRGDLPVIDQVLRWNSPVILRAEHFG